MVEVPPLTIDVKIDPEQITDEVARAIQDALLRLKKRTGSSLGLA